MTQMHAFEPGADERFCARTESARFGSTCGYPRTAHPTGEELVEIASTNRAPVGWSWPTE